MKRIVVLGGSGLSFEIAKLCRARGIEFHLFTGPRLADFTMEDGGKLLDRVRELGFEANVVDDVNMPDSPAFELGGEPTTLAISNGSPFLLRQNFLDRYLGQVINSHWAPLPKWRGGGGFSWRILAGDRRGNCCFHLISPGIDDGDIVFQRAYSFPAECRLPIDYEPIALQQDIAAMMEFLGRLMDGEAFLRLRQNEENSTYYPRLHTVSQGYIDWRWQGPEIERFIYAFSHPYPGARSFVGKLPVTIFNVRFEASDTTAHPFFYGHVFRRIGDKIFIHVPGGTMTADVSDVETKSSLSPGTRFFTPSSYLDQAMTFRPIYTPAGLKNQP